MLEKFATVQMIDVYVPTNDGRELSLTRYTQPEPELKLLLDKLSPPKLPRESAPLTPRQQRSCSADLLRSPRE